MKKSILISIALTSFYSIGAISTGSSLAHFSEIQSIKREKDMCSIVQYENHLEKLFRRGKNHDIVEIFSKTYRIFGTPGRELGYWLYNCK